MKIIEFSFIVGHEWDIDISNCVKPLVDPNFNLHTNLTKDISTGRRGATFLKCPAHTDFLKNTFVFHAPFDLNLNIILTQDKRNIVCDNISQEIFDEIIDTRFLSEYNADINPYPILGIDWLNVFRASSPVLLQVFPAFMHKNEFTEKTTVIPGEFNIGAWTRPVELVFELKNVVDKISIKKGDAVAYFKFNDDNIVKLVPSPAPWDEIKVCNNIRNNNTFRPLKERYEELKEKKCPYESKN